MEPDALFQLANPLALMGWIVLVFAPFMPRLAQIISGLVIPATLSLAYIAFVLVGWSGAKGGYDNLANVMLLFDTPMVALAGWVHYLAFDLFVGTWQVRYAQREGISHFLVLPCLLLTFVFGPAGLALFLSVRIARSGFTQPSEA